MIQLLVGDNTFAIAQAVREATDAFAGEAEKIDGAELELSQLPDLLMGGTLFAEQRLIIIDGLSVQKDVWSQLPTWLERASDDIEVILVERHVDKRTKAYKWLQKHASVKELNHWREYESGKAVQWLMGHAEQAGVKLDRQMAHVVVSRAVVLSDQGKAVIDQQLLAGVVNTLRLSDKPIDEAMLDTVLPQSMYENVFDLLARAVKGNRDYVRSAVKRLSFVEDGHKVAALICSQAVNLSVLNSARESDKPTSQVAKAIGVHPYALSQLEPLVKKLSSKQANRIVEQVGDMDYMIKTGQLEPWTAILTTLAKIASTT